MRRHEGVAGHDDGQQGPVKGVQCAQFVESGPTSTWKAMSSDRSIAEALRIPSALKSVPTSSPPDMSEVSNAIRAGPIPHALRAPSTTTKN